MIILFWLAVWALLALAVDNRILLATPSEAAAELIALLGKSSFYRTAAMSLLRIGAGFLTGFTAAVLLAAGSSRFPLLAEFLSPVMSLLKSIPVASFVVLLLIWWGSSFLAVAICFLVVLPNIYISTLEGLKNVDRELLEMAKVFRLPFRNRFFYIYRPALRPYLYSSMKVALGMSWKSGVAAEVIGTPDYSIGERLYLSKVYLDTAGVFAWTAVVILFSFLFEKLVLWAAGRFFEWKPSCRKAAAPQRRKENGSGVISGEEARHCGAGGKRSREKASGETGESGEAALGKKAGGDINETENDGAIALENVWKSFGEQNVLSGKSAFYERGRIYYLTEPSGSGKTTLLRIIAGLDRPDSGSVRTKAFFSMVFQEDRLCREYSAVKNVEMVTGDGRAAREALEQLLEPEALDKPCGELSGGMKRRVALVRAMEADSDCVLLDEPFTGLDSETLARTEEYIRRKQNGRTLIIATHTLSGLLK